VAKGFTDDDDALLAELGVEGEAKPVSGRTVSEERIIAGFEEIQQFVEQNGRAPQHGDERDIFERLYAVRLDRLRIQEDCRVLLETHDYQELLAAKKVTLPTATDDISDDELLAQLGVDLDAPYLLNLGQTTIGHVVSL
jgi:hypothetical protein